MLVTMAAPTPRIGSGVIPSGTGTATAPLAVGAVAGVAIGADATCVEVVGIAAGATIGAGDETPFDALR